MTDYEKKIREASYRFSTCRRNMKEQKCSLDGYPVIDCLCCNSYQKIETTELCTFPDDDKDYCKCFEVPTAWLKDILGRIDALNDRRGVDLENFLENYVWDETWFVYLQAQKEEKILREMEQK